MSDLLRLASIIVQGSLVGIALASAWLFRTDRRRRYSLLGIAAGAFTSSIVAVLSLGDPSSTVDIRRSALIVLFVSVAAKLIHDIASAVQRKVTE